MSIFACFPCAMAAAMLCGALLVVGHEKTAHIGDEVILLQADAMTKSHQRATGAAAATATAKGGVEAQKAAVKTDMFCEQEPSAIDVPFSVKATATAEESPLADAHKTAGQLADVAEDKVEVQESPPRSALAGVLEVLIVLIVLDGFRRWQSAQKEEKKVGQKTISETAKESNDSSGWEALMQAALAGDAVKADKALRGVPFAKLSHADVWGCTALHAAAKGGCTEVVQMLLQRGATVHDRDAWDETPLHLAARAGKAGACETLVAFGADIDALNAQDWTPLVVAADAGHKMLCSMLLARGAGVAGLPHADLPFLLHGLLGRSDENEEDEDERADYSEEVLCF